MYQTNQTLDRVVSISLAELQFLAPTDAAAADKVCRALLVDPALQTDTVRACGLSSLVSRGWATVEQGADGGDVGISGPAAVLFDGLRQVDGSVRMLVGSGEPPDTRSSVGSYVVYLPVTTPTESGLLLERSVVGTWWMTVLKPAPRGEQIGAFVDDYLNRHTSGVAVIDRPLQTKPSAPAIRIEQSADGYSVTTAPDGQSEHLNGLSALAAAIDAGVSTRKEAPSAN